MITIVPLKKTSNNKDLNSEKPTGILKTAENRSENKSSMEKNLNEKIVPPSSNRALHKKNDTEVDLKGKIILNILDDLTYEELVFNDFYTLQPLTPKGNLKSLNEKIKAYREENFRSGERENIYSVFAAFKLSKILTKN
jgi:hypothetical protein